MKKLNFGLLILLVVMTIYGLTLLKGSQEESEMGSIIQSQEYQATSTIAAYGIRTSQIIKPGWGSLGSVIITGAGAMEYNFYDATTTEFTDGNIASSTTFLANIPASLVAGTYVFDLGFDDGLYIDIVSDITANATYATATITFR